MKHKTNPNKEETGLRKKLRRSKQRMGFFPEMETPEKCPKFSKNC